MAPEAAGESGGFGGANLKHYWHVILERRWLVITTFFCIMVACGLYLYKAERIYRAVTRIQIDRQSSSSLDLGSVVYSLGSVDHDYLQTQYKNLTSRSLVQKVVEKLKLEEDPRYAKSMNVASKVSGDITVAPIRMTRLVDVMVDHPNKKKAAAIANALAESFQEENSILRQQKMLETLFFLQDQSDKLEREVSSAEKALQEYRESTRFPSLDKEQNFIAQALSQVQASYARAKSSADASETLVSELEKHLADGKELAAFPTIAVDPQVRTLEMTEASLLNEIAGLSQRYRDKHPTMVQAKSRLLEARDAIRRAAEQAVETIKSEARVASAQEQTLRDNVQEWETRLMEWSKARMEYEVLMRKAETSKALHNLVLSKVKQTELIQKEGTDNIRIVDLATEPSSPAKPRVALVLAGGVVGGLAVALGLALFVSFLDDSVKSQDDVETYLRLPFLGYVPNIKSNSVVERYLHGHLHPQTSASEAFRTARAAISLGSGSERVRVMTVTSTIPSEGKSLVASNLAVVIAQTGLKTLLMDADLRRPVLHKAFQIGGATGLGDYLKESNYSLDDLIVPTEVPGLDIACCVNTPTNPSELVGSNRMVHLLQEVSRRYDRVIIDCPPISAVSDPLMLSAMADGAIVVTKFNKVRREHLRRTVQRMTAAGINIFGVIINDIDFEGRDSYYYSYYYYQNRYYASYRQHGQQAQAAQATTPSSKGQPVA